MTTTTPEGYVEFRFYRPCASRMAVLGTFNSWNREALPMRANGDGWWTVVASITPGVHHFRYLADGDRWFTDFAAHGVESGRLGWNSVLVVPAATAFDHVRIAA